VKSKVRHVPTILCVDDLPLYGGALCLHLVNTVEWRAQPAHALDVLYTPDDLAHWTRHVGLADGDAEAAQHAAIAADPGAADAELQAAKTVREAIHDAVAALVAGAHAPPAALETIRAAYAEGLAAATLAPDDDGAIRPVFDPTHPRLARHAAAASAVELLGDAALLPRLRRCDGWDCGWLFLDTSRSGRRRWCSMDGCGSRDKMRRRYARLTGSNPSSVRRAS
jgi:predicted RNA-binding Zn ribbon-like protein